MTLAEIIDSSIIAVITLLLFWGIFEYIENISMARQIAAYVAEINLLHQQSIVAQQDADNAALNAHRDMLIVRKNQIAIMNQKVSSSCDGAIAWAIGQARKI